MKIIDGKQEGYDKLKEEISKINKKINFTVIQVGNDPASNVYIKQKEKMSEYIGYNFNHIKLKEEVTETEVIDIIDKLNNDNDVDGILIQMPLPKHLDTKKIQNRVNPLKDEKECCQEVC